MYLKQYRERVTKEQVERYEVIKKAHEIDWNKEDGLRKKVQIEGLVKKIYEEQLVSREDLEIRDKIITKIKDRLYGYTHHSSYPQQLTGNIKISGFGSC